MRAKKIEVNEETAVVKVPLWWLNEVLEAVKTLTKKSETKGVGEEYEYMPITKVLGQFKVSHKTLKKLIEEGKIEYTRIGRRTLVKMYKGDRNVLKRK